MELTTSSFTFVKELANFSYKLSALDRVWNILFPDQRDRWNYLHVNKYKHTFYITHVSGGVDGLEVEPNKGVRAIDPMGASSPHGAENRGQWVTTWESLIISARKWLKVARKDWIKANKRINVEYPLHYRYGIAPNALVRASLPDIYRLDKEFGKDRTRKLVRLVEDGFFFKAGKMPHQRGVPCNEKRCPECGAKMVRGGSDHHLLIKESKRKS